jgi:hypothetical protein
MIEFVLILAAALSCYIFYRNYVYMVLVYKIVKMLSKDLFFKYYYKIFSNPYLARETTPDVYTVQFVFPNDKTVYKLVLRQCPAIRVLNGCKDITSKVRPYIYNRFTIADYGLAFNQISIFKEGKCTKYKNTDTIDVFC